MSDFDGGFDGCFGGGMDTGDIGGDSFDAGIGSGLDPSDGGMDDLNAQLQAREASVIAGLDAGKLWEDSRYDGEGHAINLEEPATDENGNVVGYMINDTSGSGKVFATTEELENAGLFNGEQILITKNETQEIQETEEVEKTFGERVRNMSLDDLNVERGRLIELGVLDDTNN